MSQGELGIQLPLNFGFKLPAVTLSSNRWITGWRNTNLTHLRKVFTIYFQFNLELNLIPSTAQREFFYFVYGASSILLERAKQKEMTLNGTWGAKLHCTHHMWISSSCSSSNTTIALAVPLYLLAVGQILRGSEILHLPLTSVIVQHSEKLAQLFFDIVEYLTCTQRNM